MFECPSHAFRFISTLFPLSGNPCRLHLAKAAAAARPALPSPASAWWACSCFRNPPNSNMDYRICKARVWSFVCVRIHTGVWAHRQRVTQHCCAPDGVRTRVNDVVEYGVRRSANWATLSPCHPVTPSPCHPVSPVRDNDDGAQQGSPTETDQHVFLLLKIHAGFFFNIFSLYQLSKVIEST